MTGRSKLSLILSIMRRWLRPFGGSAKRRASMEIVKNRATAETLLSVCKKFEADYDLTSEEFYELHLAGEFVGIHDAYRWAGYWEAYLRAVDRVKPLDKGRSQDLVRSS
jgi:hypothetical protein